MEQSYMDIDNAALPIISDDEYKHYVKTKKFKQITDKVNKILQESEKGYIATSKREKATHIA